MAPKSAQVQSVRKASNKRANATSNAGSASGRGGGKRKQIQTEQSTVAIAQLSVDVAAAPTAAGNVLTRVVEADRARRAAIANTLQQRVRADMIATLGKDDANELINTAATSIEVAAANQENTSGNNNLVGDGGNDGTESFASASMRGEGVGIEASDDNNGVGDNNMEEKSVAADDGGRASVASVVTGPGNTMVVANIDPRLLAYFASLQQYGMMRGVDEDKQMVTLKIPELFRRIKFINDDSQLDEGGVIAKVLLHEMRIPVEICEVWWDKMRDHIRKKFDERRSNCGTQIKHAIVGTHNNE